MSRVFLLIDGKNVEIVLNAALARRPTQADRPHWDRVLDFAKNVWGRNAKVAAFFFMEAGRKVPPAFMSYLRRLGITTILLQGDDHQDRLSQIGMTKALLALKNRPGDVLVVTHGVEFLDVVRELATGSRRVGVAALTDWLPASATCDAKLEIFDLQADVLAFDHPIPGPARVHVDDFDFGAILDARDAEG